MRPLKQTQAHPKHTFPPSPSHLPGQPTNRPAPPRFVCPCPSTFTPTGLVAVVPRAGPPGTPLQLMGEGMPWNLRNECRREADGLNEDTCVGDIMIGDYLCESGVGTDDSSTIYSEDLPDRYSRTGAQFSISCRLPDPSEGDGNNMVRRCACC